MFVKKIINNRILDNRETNANSEKKIIKGRKGESIFYKTFVIGKEHFTELSTFIEKPHSSNKPCHRWSNMCLNKYNCMFDKEKMHGIQFCNNCIKIQVIHASGMNKVDANKQYLWRINMWTILDIYNTVCNSICKFFFLHNFLLEWYIPVCVCLIWSCPKLRPKVKSLQEFKNN